MMLPVKRLWWWVKLLRLFASAFCVVATLILGQILADLWYSHTLQANFSLSTTSPLSAPLRQKSQERLHFFTYATRFDWPVCLLAQSIAHFSSGRLHLNVLGRSTYARGKCDPVNRGRWRIHGLQQLPFVGYEKNYCKMVWMDWAMSSLAPSLGLSDSDLVVFSDGFDVLVQRNVFDIIPLFQEMEARYGVSVFLSGDGLCWPFCCGYYLRSVGSGGNAWSTNQAICTALHAVSPKSYYHYPNSGTYIGRVSALRTFFHVARVRHARQRDDQAIMALTLLEFPQVVGLDRQAKIFQTLYQTEDHLGGMYTHTIVDRAYHSQPSPYAANASRYFPYFRGKKLNSICQEGYFHQMKRTLPLHSSSPSSSSTVAAATATSPKQLRQREYRNKIPKMLITGNAPVMLHFNGLAKSLMYGCAASFLQTFPWNRSVSFYDVDRNQFRSIAEVCPKKPRL